MAGWLVFVSCPPEGRRRWRTNGVMMLWEWEGWRERQTSAATAADRRQQQKHAEAVRSTRGKCFL
ncbi:YALI0A14608p [Anopheles sinensis]|uniref:YALI0A14608p n=1 Tax=Anopheles sinensis TaxID=74873 RepID=A0A084WH99_ANOSI|nr:YALI0A14608p [Anopheles sinensis]